MKKSLRNILILTSLIISCNQETKTKPDTILEMKNDGEVHYESTNEAGEFDDHKILEDPLAKTYDEGMVIPNQLSSKKTILDNGPSKNRIDIVLVGDGYTKSQLTQYAEDAQKIANKFLDEEPLKSYKSYFNVHRVDVISQQSGVSNDPSKGAKRSTALGMNFWCSGIERLLCANIQSVKQYAANAPAVDQILAIANSDKHGGAGYWTDGVGTLAGRNANAIETAIHEFAHTFGKLGDEYEYAGSSTSECAAKANGSTIDSLSMLKEKKKWYQWLDLGHIKSFKGSCYSTSVYRPTINSKMRTLGLPFYEVSSEQLIFEIYKKVKPIDSATASGTYAKNRILKIVPMQPVGSNLDVRWYLNGKEIVTAAQTLSLSVASLNLLSGTHKITATVTDLTPKVRNEALRKSLMSESRTWTIK